MLERRLILTEMLKLLDDEEIGFVIHALGKYLAENRPQRAGPLLARFGLLPPAEPLPSGVEMAGAYNLVWPDGRRVIEPGDDGRVA